MTPLRRRLVGACRSVPLTPAGRIDFWKKLHQRMATLGNRVDTKAHTALLAAIHAKVPLPTQADQQAVQLDHAKADVQFWETISENDATTLADHKAMIANLGRSVERDLAAVANSAEKAKIAADRLAAAERGDPVAAPKPMSRKALLATLGWKPCDLRHGFAWVRSKKSAHTAN